MPRFAMLSSTRRATASESGVSKSAVDTAGGALMVGLRANTESVVELLGAWRAPG